MGVPTHNFGPMTAEEFFAFTETRPDNEKWELIEGEPILNASASRLHQRIIMNLIAALLRIERARNPDWEVLLGIGVRISTKNVPVPDALVRPRGGLVGVECDDMMVAFEVLSPSTVKRDLSWKRRAYASLPTLSDYVVLAQDSVIVQTFSRRTGWAKHRLSGVGAVLDLPEIEVSLPLGEIYADTGLR